MKCSNCGKEIANDSMFCEYCGTKTRNDEQRIKKADIRWSLLPAMIIATIAMGFASESTLLYKWGSWDHSTALAFIIPLFLFVITCWYSIRKTVLPSFLAVMVVLFGFNCLILYDSINTRDVYRYEIYVNWKDDGNYVYGGQIGLSTMHNYYINNMDEAKGELEEMAFVLRDKLQAKGKTDLGLSTMLTTKEHYTNWGVYSVLLISSVITLLYLIYAFIAHKRDWKF